MADVNDARDGGLSAPGPDVRSSTEQSAIQASSPRRFSVGQKVSMRRGPGQPHEFDMLVVAHRYDEDRGGWNYKLKEENTNVPYAALVKESDLKKRK